VGKRLGFIPGAFMKKMSSGNNHPPCLAEWMLNRILPDGEWQTPLGDFEEHYHEMRDQWGAFGAWLWYWGQVARLIPQKVVDDLYWRTVMLKNYLKIAWRNILRQKGYSFINVFGLALGMALCILILRWAQYEMSYNTFHEKIESMYLVRFWEQYGSERQQGNGSVPALGPALQTEYPEVVYAARFQNGQRESLLEYGENKLKERIQMADPSVFDMFTFPLVKGVRTKDFSDPYIIVLSEKTATKFFGDEDPIGKIMTLDGQFDMRVVGVMKEIPQNSTIRFDVWVPIQLSRVWIRENYIDTWYNLSFRTYVELADGVSVEVFNEKIKDRIRRSDPETVLEPFLYPFGDEYLKLWGGMDQIRTFGLIALFVLIIACINFMNLTTARSARRAKEVGLRKVVGAQKKQLMRQFFGESILITVFSLFVAVLLAELSLPLFRTLTGQPIQTDYMGDMAFSLGIVGIALLTGVIAGIYPAFFLSAFRPIRVLRTTAMTHTGGGLLRKILVVVQFVLSIILIIGTTVIYNQTRFMKMKDLGFNKDQLVYMRIEGNLKQSHASMKTELLRHPDIRNVAVTSHSPSGIYWNGHDWEWEGRDPNVNPLVTYFFVDEDVLETFQMQLADGRFFSREYTSSDRDVVINEQFAHIMGMESPIGKQLSHEDDIYRVIGVVKDFHYKPVWREIGPIVLFCDVSSHLRPNYLFLRVNSTNLPRTIEHIKNTAQKFNPAFPFEYRFLDEDYERMYRWAERMMNTVRTFAVMAIFISCLGLFGLAAFMAEQRTKEIGVRKVFGASITSVTILLTKEFTKWVLVSCFIAWPVAYWIMGRWLRDFAYKTKIGIGTLTMAAGIALIVAWLTVSYQSIRAARANPVDALKYE
jgi:predicted permease